VHQMRVAVRRLRALLSLFKALLAEDVLKDLRGDLKSLQRQLGRPRDWDVFIGDAVAPLVAGSPSEDALTSIHRTAWNLRNDAYEGARAVVASGRYTGLLLRLQLCLADDCWFRGDKLDDADYRDQPVRDLAAKLLDKRAQRLNELGDRHETLSRSQLHRLRIEAKKMRYAVDFFRSLYPASATRAYRASLVRIQDCLGVVNDVVVGGRLLEDLAEATKNSRTGRPEAVQSGLRLLRDRQVARMADNLHRLEANWKRHVRLKPFW